MKQLIVIPAYNEALSLEATVAALNALPQHFEVLVVNDGSTDATATVIDQLCIASERRMHVVHLPTNSGIGVAMQTGYLFAQRAGIYEYVVQFDADGQHDASAIVELIEACRAHGWDLCIGSRFLYAGADGFRSTLPRRIGIRFFNRLISVLTGARVTDSTSGFRCAGPRAWTKFAKHYPDDYPEPESLYWCIRHGLSVGEIPVRMMHRRAGVSSIRRGRSVYYMFKVTLAILVEGLRRRGFNQR